MQGRTSQQTVLTLPAIVLGAVAVVVTSYVDDVVLRGGLQAIAVLAIAAIAAFVASTPANAVATEKDRPKLEVVRSLKVDRRRPTFDRETGLHAEWYFRLRVEEEIARAKRYGQLFTLLVFSAKDATVLDAARATTKQFLREVDFAGDLGDMLVLCLPNTPRTGADIVMGRIGKLVKDLEVRVAQFPSDGETFTTLLGRDEWRVTPLIEDDDEPLALAS